MTLSTFYDPKRLGELPTVAEVDAVGIGEQHPVRRWEYALALGAVRRWLAEQPVRLRWTRYADVGGAGSPFDKMLDRTLRVCSKHDKLVEGINIDPNSSGYTLDKYLLETPRLCDIVTCLSVIEHVDDLPRFLYHLSCLVRPGGLLVLTMDACGVETAKYNECWPEDVFHFHWMRQRIFGPKQLEWLRRTMIDLQCCPVEPPHYVWPGPTDLYDYGAASLVLQKRP